MQTPMVKRALFARKPGVIILLERREGRQQAAVFFNGRYIHRTAIQTRGAVELARKWCQQNGYQVESIAS